MLKNVLNREILLYLLFGILTTVVNLCIYSLCYHVIKLNLTLSVLIAWILSVLFAFFTNRTWVFQANTRGFRAISKECVGFFAGRVGTGIFDILFMLAWVNLLTFHDMSGKIVSNILVIVLNYLISKFLIFSQKGIQKNET